jgi:hypothetical protein
MRVPAIRSSCPKRQQQGGRRWRVRGPSLSRTPVRAFGRLELLFKCRPPKRPHEPSSSTVPISGGGFRTPLLHPCHPGRTARSDPGSAASGDPR